MCIINLHQTTERIDSMKYMDSKNRIARHLIPIMIAEADSKGDY